MPRENTIRRTIALGLLLAGACRAPLRAAACRAAAIEDGQVLTLRQVIADPVLHRSWAVYQNCAHPERPLEVRPVPASGSAADSAPQSPHITAGPTPRLLAGASEALPPVESTAAASPQGAEIHAGDRVHLWSAGDHVRLEVEAVALEYGHAGQVIHLRRLARGTAPGTLLAGVVDGPGSAELLP